MTEKETLQTESQSISENNKPWYKKKNTIIASTSILGVGTLVAVIAIPIALTTTTTPTTPTPPTPPTPPPTNTVQDAINLLNVAENKGVRATLWNAYMTSLTTAAKAGVFDTMVREDAFINGFISFLTDNLYVTATGSETGAITKADADLLKSTLSNTTNIAHFKSTTLAIYNNLFSFGNTAAMFTFKDNATDTSATINFTLTMPTEGWDVVYNSDETANITTPKDHSSKPATKNIVLTISKFTNPNITANKEIYFKPGATIQFPSSMTTGFPTFFNKTVTEEKKTRDSIIASLDAIQKRISSDSTNTVGLSYWNSFALNYATSNNAFLKADFGDSITAGNIYLFLKNAKTEGASPTGLTDVELTEIKTLSQSTTEGEFVLSSTPFASSPSYSNLLFDTNKTGASGTSTNNYSLELTITKFSYEFAIDNLFQGQNAYSITPKLELSGKLIKETTTTNKASTFTNYVIPSTVFDVSKLISMVHDTSTASGGFKGFLTDLVETTTISEASKLTNGLVNLNMKPTAEQISFWNTFATVPANKTALHTQIKAADVLYNFIDKNIDWKNSFQVAGKTFPTISTNDFKTNFNAKAAALVEGSFNFNITTGTAAVFSLSEVQWDSTATNKFTTISIYFGNETDSMSNFNVTSSATNSNVSFSQKEGASDTVALTSNESIKAAAAKRFSIVFETSTDAFVFYFGQSKVTEGSTVKQVIKPVIIPQTILTTATKFIDAVKAIK